ncbi:hypothetical protein IMZ11_37600 [Microtetraspora sp. AC03309]|nr:hypothetical protein [Microtetraspora sp. AC03309]
MTQTDLAHELGVSQAWVSEVSRGQKETGMAKAVNLLARVGWEIRISPKLGESVECSEFLSAAVSVIFVPSNSVNPYQGANYVNTLATSLARSRYELGGIPLMSRASSHMQHVDRVLKNVSERSLQKAGSELMYQVTLVLYDAGKLASIFHVYPVAG